MLLHSPAEDFIRSRWWIYVCDTLWGNFLAKWNQLKYNTSFRWVIKSNMLVPRHIPAVTYSGYMEKPRIKILHHTKLIAILQHWQLPAANWQTIPPVTPTYFRDNNISLPLLFTLDKIKINRQASWCHRDNSRGLVDFTLSHLIGGPRWNHWRGPIE